MKDWVDSANVVRRTLEQLWGRLREASREELGKVPELRNLLEIHGSNLVAAGRLAEAADLVRAASHSGMRLSGSVYRKLAQAQARGGEATRAEATIRELLKQDTHDVEALRLLYRLLKESGRPAEAHDTLNRLVELDPSGGTATFAHRERAKLGETRGRPVRIAILSSYVLDTLIPFLDVECRRAGLAPAFYMAPFPVCIISRPCARDPDCSLRRYSR